MSALIEPSEQVWTRFREHTATESDILAIVQWHEHELASNPAIKDCPDFRAFIGPLLGQLASMDSGATMADAMAVLAAMEGEA